MANIPELFGLDLGDSALKLCQVKQKGKGFELVALNSEKVDSNLLNNTTEIGVDSLVSKVKEVIKASKVKTKNCVISLPESAIFSRLITLPKLDKKDLDEAIHWAAKPLIPIDIKELNLAYMQIDTFTKDSQEMVNWYVVAAPKDLIARYQNLLKKAGLSLLAIETEALAVARSVFANYEVVKDALIVDFGAENTNLILARNKSVVFSQTLGTGSNALTKVIASDYGMEESKAEKYKITFGLDFTAGEGKISRSIQPIVDLIVNEIIRTLEYANQKLGTQVIQQVFITGGGSNLIKFDEYLSSKIGINTTIVNNFSKISIPSRLNKQSQTLNLSSYNVALGLSLKGLF